MADSPKTDDGDGDQHVLSLPEDVNGWLLDTLEADETPLSWLFADIKPSGQFGESWAFLTNRRLFVLSPNGRADRADLEFEMPLQQIEEAQLRDYVGAGALVVRTRERSYEVARFSRSSHHEASDFCHCLNEAVKERKASCGEGDVLPRPPRKVEHRCPKCGRALRHRGEVCPYCIDRRRVFWRLFSYLLPYRKHALAGLALTLVLTSMQVAPPYLTKVLVDDVIGLKNISLLPIVVGALIGVYVVRSVVSIFRTYVMQWLGNKVLFHLRVRLFEHLQLLPLTYYNQRQTGRIMSRVTSDLQRLQYFISEGFQEILVNFLTMVLIVGVLLLLNWRLFLLALAPVPIIAASTFVFGRYVHRLYHRIWRRIAALHAILADTIPGIRVVKSFAQERRESDRFSRFSADLMNQQMRAVKLWSCFFPFIGFLTGLGSILIFSIGGYMAVTGRGGVTVGVLVAFTGYLWQFYMPVQQFGRLNHLFQQCTTSAERVFEVLDHDVEPVERDDGIVLNPLRGKVEFRNVRFSYTPGKYALDGVSFVVQPGEMIGLVGPSGAGKSTLVHLITRLYEVDEGQILIDDCDIMELALKPFREQIGVVLQEPYLFHGTIWENIAYAKPDATADEIIAAARAANAHDFIVRMPDGYDTVIGERGQTLSGGERQRISISRAILRDPRILILDEATASVDTETEMLIQTALERLVENRTTFAIAHRLSTLRKANRLFVLENGKLVETGTHEELVNSGGLYARLCKLQSELSKMRAW